MVAAVQESSILHFLQKVIYEPYLEGASRINRAIENVPLSHEPSSKNTLLSHVWTVLIGISLMVPIINSVIWICMQRFGEQERPAPEEVIPLAPSEPAAHTYTLQYETRENDHCHPIDWTICSDQNGHCVTKQEGPCSTRTSFDANWVQTKHSITTPRNTITIEKRGDSLFVTTVKEFNIADHPWIQQPAFGLRPFIHSSEQTMVCYNINLESLELRMCLAEKQKEGITFTSNEGIKSLFTPFGKKLATFKFDPANDTMLKMEYPIDLVTTGSSTLKQSDLLPE